VQVYLIRHAQCELNVLVDGAPLNKRLSRTAFNALLRSDLTSPLTPEGEAQAQQLARRLAKMRFDRLYTSPMARAVATAAALSQAINLTPEVIEDLRELRTAELREGLRELALWRLLWRSYTRMLFSPASPDRLGLVFRRARRVWGQVTDEPAEAVVVVSHGMMIHFLLLSISMDRRWRVVSRDLRNCGVSLVELRTTRQRRSFLRRRA
jgi:broad specificity phosphatase PhoE